MSLIFPKGAHKRLAVAQAFDSQKAQNIFKVSRLIGI